MRRNSQPRREMRGDTSTRSDSPAARLCEICGDPNPWDAEIEGRPPMKLCGPCIEALTTVTEPRLEREGR